jgi:hypothetical protein
VRSREGLGGDIVDFGDLPRACAQLYAGQAIGNTVIEGEPRLP